MRNRWSAPARLAMFLSGGALILGWSLSAMPRLAAQAPSGAEIEGQWSGIKSWPIIAIHATLLPTGNVLVWPRGIDRQSTSDARVWDPDPERWVAWAPNMRTNLFCAGHNSLPDGRLLVTGGHVLPSVGVPDTNIFNPFNNSWSPGPPMNGPRWYPTQTTLPNGEVLIVAGTITPRKGSNRLPQVWTLSGGWRDLTKAKRGLPEYPFMHLAPNGAVFLAGPGRTTRYLDTSGRGRWRTVARRTFGPRPEGSSVMYAEGRVLTLGGADPPTASAEVIDLNARRPRWRKVSSMAFRRRHHTATLLPDGQVLVTGGTAGRGFNNESGAVLAAEIWDPATETFTQVADMAVPRIYHSTALLLPDGRVLCAGGEGLGGTPRPNAEIYSPPYLFAGPRPGIGSAPAAITYGQTFFVGTANAADISRVTWLRLGAVTHGYNQDQRINRLAFTRVPGGLAVTAPADPRLCPPGYHMLFILNGAGVPSVSRIIRIG